jgi:hypothetical protein
LHCRRHGHDWQQAQAGDGEEHWVCAHCGRIGERVPPRRPTSRTAAVIDDVSLDDLAPANGEEQAGSPPGPEHDGDPEPVTSAAGDGTDAVPASGGPSVTTVAVVAVGVVLVCGGLMLLRRRRARARA